MLYIDTSALLKFYKPERGTDYISRLIREAEEGKIKLLSSIWIMLESIAAIQSWLARGWINRRERDELLRRLQFDLARWRNLGCLHLEELHSILVIEAAALIIKHSLEPGDAIHLSTALRWKGEVEAFITSDRHLRRGVEGEGIEVIDPEEQT